jgi:hypothetical protein
MSRIRPKCKTPQELAMCNVVFDQPTTSCTLSANIGPNRRDKNNRSPQTYRPDKTDGFVGFTFYFGFSLDNCFAVEHEGWPQSQAISVSFEPAVSQYELQYFWSAAAIQAHEGWAHFLLVSFAILHILLCSTI